MNMNNKKTYLRKTRKVIDAKGTPDKGSKGMDGWTAKKKKFVCRLVKYLELSMKNIEQILEMGINAI